MYLFPYFYFYPFYPFDYFYFYHFNYFNYFFADINISLSVLSCIIRINNVKKGYHKDVDKV